MTAIASSTSEMRFLSREDIQRGEYQRSHIAMAAMVIIVFSSISSALIYASKADREVGEQYAAKLTLYTEAAQRIVMAREMEEKQQRMAEQAVVAASLLEKIPRSFVLAQVTASLPDGVSLLSVSLDTGHRTPQIGGGSAGTGDTSVKLTLIADSDEKAAQFVERLNQSKLLHQAKLIPADPDTDFASDQDGKTIGSFEVEAILDSAPAIQPIINGKSPQASLTN